MISDWNSGFELTGMRVPVYRLMSVQGKVRVQSGLAGPGALQVSLLGPLVIASGGKDCTPSAPKVLQVFSMLALRANKVVPTDLLIQELWDNDPPRSALTTMQTYIYQIRRLLNRIDPESDGAEMLVTKAPGYVLWMNPKGIDLYSFEVMVEEGRKFYKAGDYARAANVLGAALDMWTGCPLSNVKLGSRLLPHVINLKERYRNVLKMRIQAEVECGMHADLVAELQSLTLHFPYDEWMHEQLIRALERSGRRSDAMDAYHSLRRTLSTQLGIDPSPELERLHMELLGS